MSWGFMTPQHIATIVFTFVFTVAMYFILSKIDPKKSDKILFILSFLGYVGILGNLIVGIREGIMLYKLPFHLCSWNAILLPFAVKTKNSKLCTTLSVWSIGALIAIILNDEGIEYTFMGWKFAIYYFPHVVEFAIPILLLFLNKFKTDTRDILWALMITFLVYTLAYAVSEIITHYGHSVNYLFTMGPTNFVTDFFYSLLPIKYFYMFTTFPIIALLYIFVLVENYIIKNVKRKKELNYEEDLSS